jgi:hypothetical protein
MSVANAIAAALKTGLKELESGLNSLFGVVSWGTPGGEAANKIEVELQLKDVGGVALAKQEIIRLTCTENATLSLGSGAKGSVLVGDDTDDVVIQTNASGAFSLEVSFATSGEVSVVAGATQGSGFLDASDSVDLTFA